MHQYSSSSSGGCANSVSLSPRRSTRQPPLRQQQQQQQQQLRSSARSANRRRCPPGWARDSSDADSQGHVWSGLAATEALLPGALEQEVAALKSRLTACLSGAGAAAAGTSTQQQTVLLQHSSTLQSDAPKCDSPHTQHSDADDEHEEEAVGGTAAHSAVDSVTGSSGSDSELHAEVVRLRDRIASLRERREQLAAAEATRDHSTTA
jgi:hypothetical protein